MPGAPTPSRMAIPQMLVDVQKQLDSMSRQQMQVVTDPTHATGDPAHSYATVAIGNLQPITGIAAFGVAIWNGTAWVQITGIGNTNKMVGCSLRAADGANPVAGTYGLTEVGLTVERLDSNNSHPVSGNSARWVVPFTGWYQVNVMGLWDNTSNVGQRGVGVFNVTAGGNCVVMDQVVADGNALFTMHGDSSLAQLTAGDVLSFQAENLNSAAIVAHKVFGNMASGFDCYLVGT